MLSQNKKTFSNQAELYEALLTKDENAYYHIYSELLGKFKNWVYLHNGNEMDAEDAFQKGLINFFLNLKSKKYELFENVKITTVIFDYCKKIWLNEVASSRFKTNSSLLPDFNPSNDIDIQKDLERLETVNKVRLALTHLKQDCKNMVEWFYIDELSLKEIAIKMNMKETSAKQKRYDCTEKLKGIFSNKHLFPTK